MTTVLLMPGPEAYEAAYLEELELCRTINKFLIDGADRFKTENGGKSGTQAQVLKRAQEIAQEVRDNGDTRKVVRSAEYYLKSRWLVATGSPATAFKETSFFTFLLDNYTLRWWIMASEGRIGKAIIFFMGAAGNLTYDGVKLVAFILDWFGYDGLKVGLQSTPGHPITPPGGSIDGISGAFDGMFDDRDSTTPPTPRTPPDRTLIDIMKDRSARQGEYEMASFTRPRMSGPRGSIDHGDRSLMYETDGLA